LVFGCLVTLITLPARADISLANPAASDAIDLVAVDRPFAVAIAYPGTATGQRPAERSGRAERLKVNATSSPVRNAPAIIAAARDNGIDPWLLAAVIQVESASRAQALSTRGARGLMQLMPNTARSVGVFDAQSLFDPGVNVEAGARQLRALHARFGSLRLVLAAYNAGEAAVRRYSGVPPFAETTAYVARVLARYRAMGGRS